MAYIIILKIYILRNPAIVPHRIDNGILAVFWPYFGRRFIDFYSMEDRRMLIDQEFNSSSTLTLQFSIEFKMNELFIIEEKQHRHSNY